VDGDLLLTQFSHNKKRARGAYGHFVGSRISQGHREEFYEVGDQRLLGTQEFVEDVRRDLNERPSFLYDIPIQDIVSEGSSAFNISKDLLYGTTRNRQGSSGRAVVGYLGKELASCSFKKISEHFNRDPVVMGQGIRKLEEKIREDKGIAPAITKLREAFTRDKRQNT